MRRLIRKSYPLWTLFMTINLIVLALPIIGIASLRIFENVLHRQTEAKLISEGAYVQALYLSALSKTLSGLSMEEPLIRTVLFAPRPTDDKLRPHFPTLDLAKVKVMPPAPDARPHKYPVHPAALRAGELIQPILKEAQLQNLSAVRVLDIHGVVVATTGSELGEDLSHRYEIGQALKGHYCSVLRERVSSSPRPPFGSISRASRIRAFVAIPMLDGKRLAGVVYLSRTSLSLFRALWDIRYAVALTVMLAVTMAISLFLSYTVTRPLRSIIRQAQRVAAGEEGVSLEVGSSAPTEAHQLSQALSTMLEKLNQRMEYIEEFTRNVSHEFKTPLAGIQGAIELLNEGWEDMTDEQRSRFLNIIDADVRRMDRLVRRLIELTRIEMAAPADAATDIIELITNLALRYTQKGHSVKMEKKVEQARAQIAPDTAETMFVNLVDNAVTHAPGAQVTVVVDTGPTVVIRDEGPGISPGNMPRIFDRFFTTARDSGGTGLGLAMVKAIAQAYGATVDVESDETGTKVTVTLKPADQATSD